MKQFLEKCFKLSEYRTDVKTELLAGLTTFVTMAYVLATIPNMLSGAGFDKHVSLTVMVLLIVLTSCAMAFYTNRPFALAPGLGSVGIVASMISNEGISAPIASGVIFWSGVLFILISFLGLREAVVRVIPVSLKHSVSAEIGTRLCRVRESLHQFGYRHMNPIMSLGTLGLPVSPALKLTDRGLIDVKNSRIVDLIVSCLS